MNILIVCGEYFNQSNGLSLSTQRFVEQFKRLGDEVRVLSSDHGGISEYSVPVMRVPLVDGIMDRQNYHFAKPVRQVIREALSWELMQLGANVKCYGLDLGGEFVPHGAQKLLYEYCGLDAVSIAAFAEEKLGHES